MAMMSERTQFQFSAVEHVDFGSDPRWHHMIVFTLEQRELKEVLIYSVTYSVH
jgi:hypothetical protein